MSRFCTGVLVGVEEKMKYECKVCGEEFERHRVRLVTTIKRAGWFWLCDYCSDDLKHTQLYNRETSAHRYSDGTREEMK